MTPSPPLHDAIDPEYVAARRVLLDALQALAEHGPAVIVAGAQAIYLRTGAASLAIAPYTTDGDLAIDPASLGNVPELSAAMESAGFALSAEPGIWEAHVVVEGRDVLIPLDLIVPEGVASGAGRRSARLSGHRARAARRALGLEAALVDRSPMAIAALDPTDERCIEAEVAGEAALLIAKLHKIHDRVESRRVVRVNDKDAADVVRVMRKAAPAAIRETFVRLLQHPVAGGASTRALSLLDALFGRAGRPGTEMAVRALRLAMPADEVEALCVAYTRELLRLVR